MSNKPNARNNKKDEIKEFWPRAIILVDMNAFFASVEQLDYPELRGRPICVTNGLQGTGIITCSYEARAFGIKTGFRLKKAKELCPELIQCPARPERYAEVSRSIMYALRDITPDVEIFSVDEAFLDVTKCQKLYGSPVEMAKMVKQKVYEASGLLCSIGVSGDKTTAKYAAKLKKPNGFTVISPCRAKQALSNVPVTELCGIAKGIGRFLASYGVYTCGDMEKLPISVLAKRFGNIGRRIWHMCQGSDPEDVHMDIAAPKSMGHGKVMPPNTKDKETILKFLQHMSEKLAARLRRHELEAQTFFIGLRSLDYAWVGSKAKLEKPANDGRQLYQLAKQIVLMYWQGQGVSQVQITALDPVPMNQQLDLFIEEDEKTKVRNQVIDLINERYGEFALSSARLINRSKMPNVISPAWKPDGHRQTII